MTPHLTRLASTLLRHAMVKLRKTDEECDKCFQRFNLTSVFFQPSCQMGRAAAGRRQAGGGG